MRICIFGVSVGPIGGYITGHLAGVPRLDVGVVARGPLSRRDSQSRRAGRDTAAGSRSISGRAAIAPTTDMVLDLAHLRGNREV